MILSRSPFFIVAASRCEPLACELSTIDSLACSRDAPCNWLAGVQAHKHRHQRTQTRTHIACWAPHENVVFAHIIVQDGALASLSACPCANNSIHTIGQQQIISGHSWPSPHGFRLLSVIRVSGQSNSNWPTAASERLIRSIMGTIWAPLFGPGSHLGEKRVASPSSSR